MASVANQLAVLYAEITGITNSTEKIPRVINNADLPMIVIFYDPSTLTKMGSGMWLESRGYRAVLFLMKAQAGTETQGYDLAEPFFDTVRDYFLERPLIEVLSGDATVQQADYLGDNGFNFTPYPASGNTIDEFVTITFRQTVERIVGLTYQG